MRTETIYNRFLKEIEKQLPQKAKRTSVLADILSIEKEAVYRRLRGEVPFTFNEIILLSNKFNISIDNIIGITSEKSRPLQFKMADYVDAFDIDYKMIEEYIDVLETSKAENSEIIEATNLIPQAIVFKYDLLSKFYLFKWDYHYNQSFLTFDSFQLSKKLITLMSRISSSSKKCYNTTYILDPLIINYLTTDIRCAYSMHLISDANLKIIKQELHSMVNYIELIAQKGVFTETNQNINIYISSINLDTSYTYIQTPMHSLSMVKAFILSAMASFDKKTMDKTKTWIQSLKRTSTLISITGEKQRISFCNKQRKLIDQL